MLVRKLEAVQSETMDLPGMKSVAAKIILAASDGLPDFLIRMFEAEPKGHTMIHRHPQQHLFYFLEGNGHVVGNDGARQAVGPGDIVFTAPDEFHQVVNGSSAEMLRWFDVVGPFGAEITANSE